MKKYEKPMLVFESFELNHSIANCNPAMNQSQTTCDYDSNELSGMLEAGETVFAADACSYTLEEFMGLYEGFCLQSSADGSNLFTS